jgi:UDP-N-acetylglucosamine acyltransferase
MIESAIDPTARVAADVSVGDGVRVGPYAVVEGPGKIGDDCVIEAHAVVRGFVRLGAGSQVHPHTVIGGLPQDSSFDPEIESWVEAGEGCLFREGVTVNRATEPGGVTRIGARCFLMNNSHVGHDCTLGEDAIVATGVALGGFVQVGPRAFIGGATVIHQFVRIGTLAMVSGALGLRKDVLPYSTLGGEPIRHYRLNAVGLRRAGVQGERYRVLADAFRRLRNRDSLEGLADTPELELLRRWIASESKRGRYGFVTLAR